MYIGLPLPRSFQSMIPIVWKAIKIKIYKGDNAIIARDVELFCARMDHDKREHYGRDNFLPHFNTIR